MIVCLFEQLGCTRNDLKIPFLMSSKSWVPLCVLFFLQTSNFRLTLSKNMAYSFPQIILGLQGQAII